MEEEVKISFWKKLKISIFGLEEYQNDVNKVLEKYKSNFDSLQMYYATDEAAIDNKQYYAIIEVVCKEFVQAEKFKIIALPTATTREEYEAANGNIEA